MSITGFCFLQKKLNSTGRAGYMLLFALNWLFALSFRARSAATKRRACWC